MTPTGRNLVTALGLITLLAAVALTAPLWSRLLRRTPVGEEGPETPVPSAAPAAAQRTITVHLFFEAADRPGLQSEDRAVAFADELGAQLRNVVQELLAGSRSGLRSPFPPGARVLEVFVREGTAFVDLSREAVSVQAGSHSEIMAVYAIVNSLAANFPAVKRVQLLVDDQPVETVAGHLDASRPFVPDMSLLAGQVTTPGGNATGPATSATPLPSPTAPPPTVPPTVAAPPPTTAAAPPVTTLPVTTAPAQTVPPPAPSVPASPAP